MTVHVPNSQNKSATPPSERDLECPSLIIVSGWLANEIANKTLSSGALEVLYWSQQTPVTSMFCAQKVVGPEGELGKVPHLVAERRREVHRTVAEVARPTATIWPTVASTAALGASRLG